MRAAAVDANQAAIVAALRKAGAKVFVTSSFGGGFPDLVIGHRGRILLVEVKDGAKPASAQKLTKAQVDFHSVWNVFPVYIVNSVETALRLLA